MDIRDFGPRRNAKEFEFITDRRNKAFDPPYTGHSLPYCRWLYGKSRQITASYSDIGVTQYISYVSYMYSTV